MIDTKDSNRSLIIPKWRSIYTPNIEEFTFYGREMIFDPSRAHEALCEDLKLFESEPSITKAAELLHSSMVLNEKEILNVIATYIVKNTSSPKTLQNFAKKVILNKKIIVIFSAREKIAQYKKKLRQFPHDSLLWSEMARLYAIQGQWKKARKAINVAYQLAPDNRYIARSAARFFIHIDEPDISVHLLKKAYKINPDPMILATLVNCTIVAEQPLRKFRKPLRDMSIAEIYQNSELLATTGILEMMQGNDRKAKKFFRRGWLAPTENVIANADWIKRNRYPGIEFGNSIDFERSAEASTWRKFYSFEIEGAIEMAKKWCLEEPYSSHPFTCGSSMASEAGKNQIAADIAKEGLKANPSDMILRNNMAFALLRINKPDDADEYLKYLPKEICDNKTAAIEATRGYSYFKRGKYLLGRSAYQKAITSFIDYNNKLFAAKAKLYHAIAEKEVHTEMADFFATEAIQFSEIYNSDPSIKLLRCALR